MSGTQLNACLVVLLVAVCAQYSYGAGEHGSNCTKSSDCEFDHSYCKKYDECQMGLCECTSDYSFNKGMCKKLRKIGERCDSNYDRCYGGYSACKGICACMNGFKATEDEKTCFFNSKLGEGCNSGDPSPRKEYWGLHYCDDSKGLTCDSDTSGKCVCNEGWKEVGDHCEPYKKGEDCTYSNPRKSCEESYTCVNNKCSCGDKEREVTIKYIGTDGEETTTTRCVDDKATSGVSAKGECTGSYNTGDWWNAGENGKICGDNLKCDTCVESANAMCLSGSAEQLFTNTMAVLGLLMSALLVNLN